jgi:hypothetical protein
MLAAERTLESFALLALFARFTSLGLGGLARDLRRENLVVLAAVHLPMPAGTRELGQDRWLAGFAEAMVLETARAERDFSGCGTRRDTTHQRCAIFVRAVISSVRVVGRVSSERCRSNQCALAWQFGHDSSALLHTVSPPRETGITW